MNTTAEIYLWGTRVGIIHQELERPYASFEYDEDLVDIYNNTIKYIEKEYQNKIGKRRYSERS